VGEQAGQRPDLLAFLAVATWVAYRGITTTEKVQFVLVGFQLVLLLIPQRFATVHPRYLTPSYATIAAGIGAGLFYAVLTFASENVLTDTIYSLGIMICFYYGLTAFACIWYFRNELFNDTASVVFKLLFPLLGGLGLLAVFVVTLRDSASPDYGSGASIGGVGLVLILGLGLIVIGVAFMLARRARDPAYFRGETLQRDTPALVIDE
jgi:amino acid transporter